MYCKVHRPVNTPGVSDNKGKCVQLVEYLSKELKEERTNYDNFFSQKEDYVTPLTVMHHMDNNHRTLKRNDDKFYMLTINPSGEEQQHLIEKVTGEKTGEFPELSPEQQKEVLAEMKRLTRECMDEYARNFYREKIRSGDDLYGMGVWKQNATIKAMIPRWKPARQKPVKESRDCSCMCILSSPAWTDPRPCPFPRCPRAGETGRFLTAGMWWSALTVPSGPPGAPPGSTSGMATSLTAGPRMRA